MQRVRSNGCKSMASQIWVASQRHRGLHHVPHGIPTAQRLCPVPCTSTHSPAQSPQHHVRPGKARARQRKAARGHLPRLHSRGLILPSQLKSRRPLEHHTRWVIGTWPHSQRVRAARHRPRPRRRLGIVSFVVAVIAATWRSGACAVVIQADVQEIAARTCEGHCDVVPAVVGISDHCTFRRLCRG